MVGVFFLGYYVGSSRNKSAARRNRAAASGTVVHRQSHVEAFTFYKTLTDTGDKTVQSTSGEIIKQR